MLADKSKFIESRHWWPGEAEQSRALRVSAVLCAFIGTNMRRQASENVHIVEIKKVLAHH